MTKRKLSIDDLEADLQKLLKKFYKRNSDLSEAAQDLALATIRILGPVTK